MGAIELPELTVVEDGDLVEVDDGVEFVGDGEDGVVGELLADEELN